MLITDYRLKKLRQEIQQMISRRLCSGQSSAFSFPVAHDIRSVLLPVPKVPVRFSPAPYIKAIAGD